MWFNLVYTKGGMLISINNTTFTQYDVTGLNDNTLHHMHIMLLLLLVIMLVVVVVLLVRMLIRTNNNGS